jgi:hypothetical protein
MTQTTQLLKAMKWHCYHRSLEDEVMDDRRFTIEDGRFTIDDVARLCFDFKC